MSPTEASKDRGQAIHCVGCDPSAYLESRKQETEWPAVNRHLWEKKQAGGSSEKWTPAPARTQRAQREPGVTSLAACREGIKVGLEGVKYTCDWFDYLVVV